MAATNPMAGVRCLAALAALVCGVTVQASPTDPLGPRPTDVLGRGDAVTVSVLGLEELTDKTFRIDESGTIDLVLAGRVGAAGLTAEELRKEIENRLLEFMESPNVAVNLKESKSKTVSVVGSLNKPGVHLLTGDKTLIEVLSMAGGLSEHAGHRVNITRKIENGPIPLPDAATNAQDGFHTAAVSLTSLMEAQDPKQNILVYPGDVVSVPRAKLVYAIGDVVKPGGFALGEEESVSVLKALSMAGGTKSTAAGKKAKILRTTPFSGERREIEVNLDRIIAGKTRDVEMTQDDILFVPNSKLKGAGRTALDAAIRTITGVVIWRSR